VHGMRDKIAPKPLNSVETVARHVQWVKQPYKLRSDCRFLLGARRFNEPTTHARVRDRGAPRTNPFRHARAPAPALTSLSANSLLAADQHHNHKHAGGSKIQNLTHHHLSALLALTSPPRISLISLQTARQDLCPFAPVPRLPLPPRP
jgi:hypothetical protein